MRVVIDEGVPRQIVVALRSWGIDAARFPGRWAAMKNGDLLDAAVAAGFDALLTNDKNIADQNSLRGRPIAVVALPHNRRRPILDRIDDIADTLARARPHEHVVVGLDGSRNATGIVGGQAIARTLPPIEPFSFGDYIPCKPRQSALTRCLSVASPEKNLRCNHEKNYRDSAIFQGL